MECYKYVSAFLLSVATFTACFAAGSAVTRPVIPAGSTMPALKPAAGKVTTLTTTADGRERLTEGSVRLRKGGITASETLVLDLAKAYQTMDGFGFAITYSSCYNLLRMSPADRKAFLRRTYSTTHGYGVSYARISIGCSDFSSTEYSLCDEPGLEHFALHSDELRYVIPVLREIIAINPGLKIIAAPWTCPRWMKVKSLESRKPYNHWTDGHLNPDCYDDYALYFVKFVQAMQQHGISIYAVSPQNEPLNKGNCASLYMPWQEEADFVAHLAKAFKDNKLATKIYLYDHNYDYSAMPDQNDYPVQIYRKLRQTLGDDFDGAELIVGSAYHDYGGNSAELSDVHSQAPDKELIFTESSIGTWNDGRNLSVRLMKDMNHLLLSTVNQHCKAVLVWNLMLDDKRGPNLDGGCQTCYGAVDISSADYKTITLNSHYYVIAHASSVVRPGAVRIGAAVQGGEQRDIAYSAFRNTDGTDAIILSNAGSSAQLVTVADGDRYFQVSVPSHGVVSCAWVSPRD